MSYATKLLLLCLMGLALCLTSCTSFLPQRNTADEGIIPQTFSAGDVGTERPYRWWKVFASDELNVLIQEVFSDNLTLKQMWARLEQAKAITIQAKSGLYPQLSLEAGAGYNRRVSSIEDTAGTFKSQLGNAVISGVTRGISQQLGVGNLGVGIGQSAGGQATGGRLTTETQQYGLSLAASYELDIWGRVWSEGQAARFDFQATGEDLESAAMTLAAEVVNRWLTILELQAQKEILAEQLKTNQTYL
ncbi:MAG: TolC family protein, partial [Planctomycetota bacterium]